jgi:hypothetical protein
MRRLANGTQVSALPTPAAAVGTPGYGTNGDPGGGQEASIFDATTFNIIQEEMMSVLAAAGVSPDNTGANVAQLLAALRAMFGGTGLLGANGYMRLPGGLIVQWGYNGTEVGGNVNFAFPLTFPNACHIVLAMEASADGWGPGSCRVFGCNLRTQAGTIISSAVVTAGAVTFGSAAFFWIALGH